MAFTAKVVPFQLTASSTGTEIITSPGWGTPQAVMFFLSGTTRDVVSPDPNEMISIGWTDGINSKCMACWSMDGVSPSQESRVMQQSNCIAEPANTTVEGAATFDGWENDGIRLSYTSEFNQAFRGYAIFLAGADNVEVMDPDPSANGSNVKQTFAGAFAADIVFFVTTTAAPDGRSDGWVHSFGVATRGPADEVTQWSHARHQSDNLTTTDIAQTLADDAVMISMTNTTRNRWAELVSWASDGFTLTRNGAAFSVGGPCLGIKLPAGQSALVGNVLAPGTVNPLAIPTDYPSGDDESVIAQLVQTGGNQMNTVYGGTQGHGWSLGAADDTDTQASVAGVYPSGESTTTALSNFSTSNVVSLYENNTPNLRVLADHNNLDAPDWDIDYTVTDQTDDRRLCWWAIQRGEVAPGPTLETPRQAIDNIRWGSPVSPTASLKGGLV